MTALTPQVIDAWAATCADCAHSEVVNDSVHCRCHPGLSLGALMLRKDEQDCGPNARFFSRRRRIVTNGIHQSVKPPAEVSEAVAGLTEL